MKHFKAIMTSAKPSRFKQGFTLIEVMMSLFITMLVLGLAMNFLLETSTMNFVSAEKNDINREVRNIVDKLAFEAKQSNLFLIYPSAADADRIDSTKRVRPNESGDCILLVYKSGYDEMEDLGVDPLHDPRPITKLIIYYRSNTVNEDGEEWGPVRRWERDVTDAPITDADSIRNLEDILPSESELNANSIEVVALSEGLANGRLFYNFQNRTVMVNGKIIHGNRAKWVTDTYNFSISPRG